MNSAEIQKVEGGYRVSRVFGNLPAAMRAIDALLAVKESAFEPEPAPQVPVGVRVPQEVGSFLVAAAIERAEADDPPPHDGRSPWPVDEE